MDKTNPWTLDYPPFFAYFERLLASAAPLFDKGMLRVTRDMYDSWPTVLFQARTLHLGMRSFFSFLGLEHFSTRSSFFLTSAHSSQACTRVPAETHRFGFGASPGQRPYGFLPVGDARGAASGEQGPAVHQLPPDLPGFPFTRIHHD